MRRESWFGGGELRGEGCIYSLFVCFEVRFYSEPLLYSLSLPLSLSLSVRYATSFYLITKNGLRRITEEETTAAKGKRKKEKRRVQNHSSSSYLSHVPEGPSNNTPTI